MTRSKLVKKIDKLFSLYIRNRYSKNGKAKCFTCGKVDDIKRLHAGHFMSRKHYSTRWLEDNVKPQCYGCNVMQQGQQYKFSKYLGNNLSEEI